jgi:tetratricopeptide (TPR) repeat protein
LNEALRQGLHTFQGADKEGRDKSLTVSLDYSFAKLSEGARQHLPFLALFSERVNADFLHALSNSPDDDFGQVYRAVFGENLQKADWLGLLNEAAEAGILEHLDITIYKIHPALPWYLRKRLSEQHAAQEVSELEKKLLVFYARLAENYRKKLASNAELASFVLRVEEPNLLQNLRLAEQQQRWTEAQVILQALGKVYERLGRKPEFRLLRKRVLSKIGITLAEAKAKGRDVFNFWIYLQGVDAGELLGSADLAEIQKIHQEILNELIALNDLAVNEQIAVAYHNLGLVAQEKRDFERAVNFHEKAIKIYEAAGNFYEAAGIYYNLGQIAQQQRNFEEAIEYYENALKIHKKRGDLYEAAHDYSGLGDVAEQQGDFYKAIHYYEKALKTFKEQQDFYRVAVLCNKLGAATQQLQDYQKAIDYYREAIKIFEDTQDEISAAFVYQNLGALSWMQQKQDFEAAINYYKKAFSIFKKFQYWREASLTLGNWGRALEVQEKWNEALKNYIRFWTMNVEHHLEWINGSIKAMGRMLKVLGESQFDRVWQEVRKEDCPQELRSAIQAASEEIEE